MIKYDRKNGILSSTALGKIASHYYIKFASISIYNEQLKPYFGIVDILKVFSLSVEFKYLAVREQERSELAAMMEKVPIPIKGSIDDISTKVNILL